MLSLRRRDIVCQQAVEMVTDYLEGAFHAETGVDSSLTFEDVRTVLPTLSRSG